LADKESVKKFILDVIKDDDIKVEDINDDTVLIGEDGIFFDSVDVLELIVELENVYGIKVKDNDIVEKRFKTFSTFYEFIEENEK